MSEDKSNTVSADGVISTSKWLVAAAGAVAAASVTGLQFSGLGEARRPSLAIAAFVLAFVATALVLVFASRVLLPAYDSLADLEGLQSNLRERIAQAPDVAPIQSDSELPRFAALEPLFAHVLNGFTQSPDELLYDINHCEDKTKAAALSSKAADMLSICNAYRARARFRALLKVLIVAGLIYVVAVPVLAVNIAKPEQRSPKIDKAIAVLVRFAEPPVGLSGKGCDPTKQFSALAVGGTFDRPVVRIPAQNSCHGTSVALTADDAYAIAPE